MAEKLNPEDRPCACDNCDWEGTESQLLERESYLEQRCDPGEIVPCEGDCPECGSNCHLTPEGAVLDPTLAVHRLEAAEGIFSEMLKTFADAGTDEPMNGADVIEALVPIMLKIRKAFPTLQLSGAELDGDSLATAAHCPNCGGRHIVDGDNTDEEGNHDRHFVETDRVDADGERVKDEFTETNFFASMSRCVSCGHEWLESL